jgi:hypothetical protein
MIFSENRGRNDELAEFCGRSKGFEPQDIDEQVGDDRMEPAA